MTHYALTVDKFLEHAAKWHGTAEVVCASPGGGAARHTYAELSERALLVSGGLLARGLAVGDRIGTLAWNTADHLTLYYAAMGAGLVCHTLNPCLSASRLAAMIAEAADRWLAVGTGLQPLLAQVLPSCRGVEGIILLDDEPAAAHFAGVREQWTLEDFIGRCGRQTSWGHFDESSPAGLHASSTVDPPRDVLCTHRSNYLHTLHALQADAVALTAGDTFLIAVPMFHAEGVGLPFAAPAAGARMVLPGRRTEPADLKRLIEQEKVTVAAADQAACLGLAALLESEGVELSSLQRVIVGGSYCPDGLVRHLAERLGITVHVSRGMIGDA